MNNYGTDNGFKVDFSCTNNLLSFHTKAVCTMKVLNSKASTSASGSSHVEGKNFTRYNNYYHRLHLRDNAPHTDDPEPDFSVIFNTVSNITSELRTAFHPSIPILPVLGNHDAYPKVSPSSKAVVQSMKLIIKKGRKKGP